MNELTASLLFIAGVAVMAYASYDLTKRFERLGSYFHFSGVFLGMVTAIGADAPEISTAFVALFSGNHDVGLGVVFGSNIFNLAGLLALPAMLAGRVVTKKESLVLNGGYSTLLLAVIMLIVFRLIPLYLGIAIVVFFMVAYFYVCLLNPQSINRLKVSDRAKQFLQKAIASESGEEHNTLHKIDFLLVIVGIAVVVAASTLTVKSAIFLATAWQLSEVIVGVLVLSVLTSLPNVIAAIKLVFEKKDTAVVSEAFNSNNINLLGGVCLPLAVFGLPELSGGLAITIFWYLLMNISIVVMGYTTGLVSRRFGAVIALFYLVFAGAVIYSQVGGAG